jgi:DNA replication ATP-dependent helicase/nuclease Dna2
LIDEKNIEENYVDNNYLLDKLSELENLGEIKDFQKSAKKLFNEFINYSTKDEKQFFSGNYTRAVFLLNKSPYSGNIKEYLNEFLFILKSEKIENLNYDFIISFLSCLLLKSEFLENKPRHTHSRKSKNKITLKAIVLEKVEFSSEKSILNCTSEKLGEFKLILYKDFSINYKLVRKGYWINLIDFSIKNIDDEIDKNKIIVYNNKNSLLVINPDYLLDVTDISECFSSSSFNVNLYFLKKFSTVSSSSALIIGNIINHLFDEIVVHGDLDFDALYDQALGQRPISVFSLAISNPKSFEEIKQKAQAQFENLIASCEDINEGLISVEPSFASPKYGLQGRLDALLEYDDDENRKDIIELKSGRPPSVNIVAYDSKGNPIRTGVWPNHLAQTTAYNMLLDSAFENRSGYSQILYSQDMDYPFRNAPNIIKYKREVIELRNWIVALELSFASGKYSVLESLNPRDFGARPPYVDSDIAIFWEIYSNLDEIQKNWFTNIVAFLLREIHAGRTGMFSRGDENGFASLWNDELSSDYIIKNAVLNKESERGSDFQKFHLVFNYDNENNISALRRGDYVVLWPSGNQYGIEKGSLIKGYVREEAPGWLKISLRNKLTQLDVFESENWVIARDHSDALNKRTIPLIFEALKSSKINIILGFKESIEENIESEHEEYFLEELSQNQNYIYSGAINASDYFMIQGPPGTGKTSYLLKNLVKYYFESEKENTILLCANTNRAVDEICLAIEKVIAPQDYIRLGTKESGEITGRILPNLISEHGMRDVFSWLQKTKIIVSTVSSLTVNPEIFEIKHFDIAIVDEAAQITEAHIVGVVSKCDKFIMIGDEKQLPAVVVQDGKYLECEDELLNNICFRNHSNSLFERLINLEKSRGESAHFGMLTRQARMHSDIMRLSNELFYENKLALFDKNRQSENLDNNKRVKFIDSSCEIHSKTNLGQAENISILVENLLLDGNLAEDIGIITPFRKQVALTKNKLTHIKEAKGAENILVDTVERFQGAEKNIIIISMPINYKNMLAQSQSVQEIAGVMVDRKLNVAITRAKEKLFIFGNKKILSNSPIWKKLIDLIEN